MKKETPEGSVCLESVDSSFRCFCQNLILEFFEVIDM